jgi:DNA adenine methylase
MSTKTRRAEPGGTAPPPSGAGGAAPAAPPPRAALRYYGGKARLAPWIVAHLPPHTGYVEPFGGAASVLLRKAPAPCEVYNDLDGEIVGFFRVLRERPGELVEAVRGTPFARAEIDLACAPTPPGVDDLERARRVYVRAWQGRHGLPARGRMGWRFERAAAGTRTAVAQWTDLDRLWETAARLRAVQLECGDALRVLARFDGPDTLFYVDPPYPADTRGARWATRAYAHELTDADHRRLAETLRELRGMAVVSGYPCPLYRDLYADRPVVTRRARTNGARAATEALWLSPRAAGRLGARQLSLLGGDLEEERP